MNYEQGFVCAVQTKKNLNSESPKDRTTVIINPIYILLITIHSLSSLNVTVNGNRF